MDKNAISLIWPIEKLKNWSKNPRTINEADFVRLKAQIQKLGTYKPLIVTEDGIVLGGNMRLKALQDLKAQEVWVSVVDAPDDATKLEYALSDNDRAGDYNELELSELISLNDIDMDLYKVDLGKALTLAELPSLIDPNELEDDEVPEVEGGDASSALGTVYQLGRHKLMCGDSTKDLATLLDGASPSMVFTDPPYGVDYQSRVDETRRKGWGKIENDNLQGKELHTFIATALGQINCPKYVCCNWQSYIDFEIPLGKPNALIVWNKGSIGLGAGYRNQHEFILFYGTLDHNSESNVWDIKRDNDYEHPTQKPVAIPARAIKNSTKANSIVLDIFGGSGSTLIACEQIDRTCYMMELDPKYCDVIRKRYAKLIDPEGWEEQWQTMTPAIQ